VNLDNEAKFPLQLKTMNDKKIIAVDIDQTLHEFRHTVLIKALNDFGEKLVAEPGEWGSGIYPVTCYTKGTQLFHSCYSREGIFLTKPYPGSPEALNELARLGYQIEYFTDRPSWAHDDTQDWLKTYGFPNPDRLHCCDDKRSVLVGRKNEILTIFDDRPRTLQFAQMVLGFENVFSVKHMHNRNLTDMEGMWLYDTWDELLAKFKEIYER
jgi:hypothetical protein